MAARRSRAKPRPPPDVPTSEEITTSMSAEQLDSLRDESEGERPTIRLPARPPFAPPAEPEREEVTAQARVLVGPDGVARVLDAYVLDEETVPGIPRKDLLARGKTRKLKAKRR
jgi:hypothetical protein